MPRRSTLPALRFLDYVWRFCFFRVLRVVLWVAEFRAHGGAAGNGESAVRDDGPNVPGFHHGGGTVDYSGQTAVPCGAFSSGFTGASPPPSQIYSYQFSIKALGPNGAVLATTTTRRKFPE